MDYHFSRFMQVMKLYYKKMSHKLLSLGTLQDKAYIKQIKNK